MNLANFSKKRICVAVSGGVDSMSLLHFLLRHKNEFDSVSLEEYEKELEKKITELCSRVDGVSSVTVAVSLSGGFEYVYATDSSGNPVTVGSGGSASGIILKKKVPEIAGIGIVCRGGGNEAVRNRLVSLISSTYGIGANRVFITEAKK